MGMKESCLKFLSVAMILISLETSFYALFCYFYAIIPYINIHVLLQYCGSMAFVLTL